MDKTLPAKRPRPEPAPRTHLSLQELNLRFQALPASPRSQGRVALLCSRLKGDLRWLPRSLRVDPETGFPEDRWFRQMREKSAKYGEAYQEMQVATMELSVARLIANGQDLSLFGDNLFLDLDLSGENLPAGSQLRIGEARFQVTPFPHDGCSLFRARFGEDALRFTANPKTRGKNLRGIYLKVLEPGILNVEDPVEVLQRGPTAD